MGKGAGRGWGGTCIVLVNIDMYVTPGWLAALLFTTREVRVQGCREVLQGVCFKGRHRCICDPWLAGSTAVRYQRGAQGVGVC